MSSLLEQAIIDAEALKQVALKNAENRILEKYSSEVKKSLKLLLEQEEGEEDPLGLGADEGGDELGGEEMGLGGEEEIAPPEPVVQSMPDAFADGEKLCPCPDEDEEIEIDFNDLAAQLQDPEAAEAGDEVDREDAFGLDAEEPLLEELEDLLYSTLLEEVTFDGDVTPAGTEWTEQETADAAMISNAKTLANAAADNDVPKELKGQDLETITLSVNSSEPPPADQEATDNENLILHKEKQQLAERLKRTKQFSAEEIKKLKETNKALENKISVLREQVLKVNLANAKLLYTNRALGSASLNERQKNKIVESISRAGSVEEAKTIYETLQSTVSSASSRRAPNSLSEAVNRGRASTIFAASRKENKTEANPELDRWRLLAGLGKN